MEEINEENPKNIRLSIIYQTRRFPPTLSESTRGPYDQMIDLLLWVWLIKSIITIVLLLCHIQSLERDESSGGQGLTRVTCKQQTFQRRWIRCGDMSERDLCLILAGCEKELILPFFSTCTFTYEIIICNLISPHCRKAANINQKYFHSYSLHHYSCFYYYHCNYYRFKRHMPPERGPVVLSEVGFVWICVLAFTFTMRWK